MAANLTLVPDSPTSPEPTFGPATSVESTSTDERPLLGAALIVRDEAHHLPECLAALDRLRPLLGEIVVHDTGSRDDSVAIAERAGARVVRGTWADDFAAARNVALAAGRARWVLSIDADERVAADLTELAAALRGRGRYAAPDADVLTLPLVNVGSGDVDLYAVPMPRLLRRDRVHFVGALHEQPQPRRAGARLQVGALPARVIGLRHLGYTDPAVVAAKAERNLRLAAVEVARAEAGGEPERLARALYHRGRTLVSAQQPRAALSDLLRLRALALPAPTLPERTWGLDVLAQLLLSTGEPDAATTVLDELAGLVGDHGGDYVEWLRARADLARADHVAALGRLRRIDRVTDTVGRTVDEVTVLEAHLVAAARSGVHDEAIALCIRLIAGHGRGEQLAGMLVSLWGNRPVEALADLLRGADRGHLGQVVTWLSRCPEPGPRTAAALVG